MRSKQATFPLRMPVSLKAAVERMPEADGTSMNQFLAMAAAEKVASIQTAETFFAARRGRGDLDRTLSFLSRQGGEPPSAGDEIPTYSASHIAPSSQ